MNSIDPARITFRPVTPDDYPQLRDWMARPHWRQWWGDPDTELGYIVDMVEDRDTTRPFIFQIDGLASGYIQVWRIADHLCEPWISRTPWLRRVPSESVGVDLAIGAPSELAKGIGTAALKAFVAMLIAEGHVSIIIDPDAANARAIRAYRKAGFEPLFTAPDPDRPDCATLLMQFRGDATDGNGHRPHD